jgi:hypothetical protein
MFKKKQISLIIITIIHLMLAVKQIITYLELEIAIPLIIYLVLTMNHPMRIKHKNQIKIIILIINQFLK